jgi:Fe-S-cluster containining protein
MDDFSRKMEKLYNEMQKAYDDVAGHYDSFSCKGCTDNCCTQRFFHHTLAEYRYLKEGLMEALKTDPYLVRQMLIKARIVTDTYTREKVLGDIVPLMCPVNLEGLCRLYKHRPMICRLHGLPHRFKKPDGSEERGTGCARFEGAHKTDWTVNRSKLYTGLAAMEADVRRTSGFRGRYSLTTAEMLMDMVGEERELRALLADEE